MNDKKISDFGEKAEEFVQDTLGRIDFDDLNNTIINKVNEIVGDVQENLKGSTGQNQQRHQPYGQAQQNRAAQPGQPSEAQSRQPQYSGQQHAQNHQTPYSQRQVYNHTSYRNTQAYANTRRRIPDPRIRTTTGDKAAGIIMVAAGSLIAIFAVLIICVYLDMYLTRETTLAALWGICIVCAPMLVIFTGVLISGIRKLRLIERFRQYVYIIGERTYISLKELADRTSYNENQLRKDLKKMIRKQMFLQGSMDESMTCLMLNREVYAQYQQARRNYEESRSREQADQKENELDQEIRETIRTGRACIAQIKASNEAIPGVEISNKMYRLETVVSKIFDHVEEKPEKVSEIHRLMDYYLPTTLKLITTYEKLDAQPISSDNIEASKNEIEKTLDIINEAFETLFDSLFADVALDISTDARALKTILAQEGLSGNGIKMK